MKNAPTTFLRRWPAIRLGCGGCLLLLYLLAATPLAPVLTTLIAMTDRSHHVLVQPAGDGVRVVLHHECLNSPTHHHGIVARALTVIAEPPTSAEPDHVIQFSGSAGAIKSPALLLTSAAGVSAPESCPPGTTLPSAAPPAIVPAAHPRPPPDIGGALLRVRSTVFLI